jgi:GTP cyclohydrolase I
VLLEAEHTCMTLRGAHKRGSRLVTISTSGIFATDASARGEALGLLASARGDLPSLTR